jgi:hypothetical protein
MPLFDLNFHGSKYFEDEKIRKFSSEVVFDQ